MYYVVPRRLCSTLLLSTLFVPAAAGQRPDTIELAPLVVTATRVPVAADAVASAITVISGAELRRRGIRTVAQALRQVPGVAIAQTGGDGGQTSLFLRGGEGDYVKVLVDGVPLNQPGGAFDFAHLTTDNVERIEIVRGPVSVLYGSDAVTGVIQVFTRNGLGPAQLTARVDGGYDQRHRAGSRLVDASVAGGGARIGYALGVSRFGSGGPYGLNDDYRNTVWSTRVLIAPDARSDASVTLRHGEGEYHFPTDGAGRVVDSNQFTVDRGPAVAAELGRRVSSRLEVRALLGFREAELQYVDDPDNAGDTALVYRSRDRVRRRGVEARANLRMGGGTLVTAGLGVEEQRYRRTDVCLAGSFDCSSPAIDTVRATRAGFAQVLAPLGRPVTLTVGARVDDNTRFGTFWTWRGGATWRMAVGMRLRASAGTGFKEPTFYENYAGGFVTGNRDLRPERSRSWEAGIERAVGGRVTAAATYFAQRFDSLIVYDFASTPNYRNVARATSRGVELAVEASLPGGITGAVNYTYLRTRVAVGGGDPTFVDGGRLLRRPAHAANLRVGYQLPRGPATLVVRFVGDRDDLDYSSFPGARVTLHPFTQVDLAVEQDLVVGNGRQPAITVRARVENLFGDDAREVVNYPTRGRTVFLGGEIRVGS